MSIEKRKRYQVSGYADIYRQNRYCGEEYLGSEFFDTLEEAKAYRDVCDDGETRLVIYQNVE
jgi:hypothetical protein